MDTMIKPLVYRGKQTEYFISENGEVYNKKFRKLKPFFGKNGYVRCPIRLDGRNKLIYVHVAVWESFNGPIPEKMEVNHIRAIKTDNRLSQLELVTKQGNMDHAKRLGLIPRGEATKQSKYTEKVIREACELLQQGMKQKKVANITGLPLFMVTSLANNTRWKHIVAEYDIHNNGKHSYTQDEDARLINLFSRGWSYDAISEKMGLPIKSIKMRLFHLGYKKGTNHMYTKSEEAELMELYEKGVPCNQLAKKFGVSLGSIYGKIHNLHKRK